MKQILTLLTLLLVTIAGAWAQPQLTYNQTTQNMGTIKWQVPKQITFKVTNSSTQDITITDVRPDCGCTAVSWPHSAIRPGSSVEIKATYDAELLGHFTKQIAVYSSTSKKPTYLTLTGVVATSNVSASASQGYPYQVGDLYLSTDNIEFDNVSRGDSPTYVLNVMNAGKSTYTPELMHLPKYLTAEYDPVAIRPGRVGRIILTLNSEGLSTMGLTQTNIYLSRFRGDRVSKDNDLIVSTTLLPDLIDTPSARTYAPSLQLDSTHVVLPKLNKKGKTNGQIILKNTGRTPLEISALQVYNTQIGVSLDSRRINPGESKKMKITINNEQTSKGRRSILLITNDPEHQKVVIDVDVKQ